MPIINRGKIPHVVFSYLTSAFMAGTETGQLKTYNKYRYASSINLVPILDKSSPFLCTVYLFDGEDASVNKNQDVIKIGDMPKSTGFFIDSSFNEIDITHNFEASKGGFMTEVKKKVLDTIQSFFKDDPAMAAAGISAFKEVPGIMSFVNLFMDADKLTDFSASFNRILANSQLRYPEEHIKVYNGSNIEVPNIVVKKHYISFDASNDPYEDLFKDIITLKLLPTLFSPSSFEVVKNLLAGIDNALGGKDIKFDVLETDIYQPFIEVASFLYYYTNMACQAYLVATKGGEGINTEWYKLFSDAPNISYNEFQYFYKYDPNNNIQNPASFVFNRPSVGYCLVGICLSPLTGYQDKCLDNPDCLVKSGILIAWFFGGLFEKRNGGKIPTYLNYEGTGSTAIYFPQVSSDMLLHIYSFEFSVYVSPATKEVEVVYTRPNNSKTAFKPYSYDTGVTVINDRYKYVLEDKTYVSVDPKILQDRIMEKLFNFKNEKESEIITSVFTTPAVWYDTILRRANAFSDYLFNNGNKLLEKSCEDNTEATRLEYDASDCGSNALNNLNPDYNGYLDYYVTHIIPLIILNRAGAYKNVPINEDEKNRLRSYIIDGPVYYLFQYAAFLSFHTTLFKLAGLVQRFYGYVLSKKPDKPPPKLLSSMSSYGSGTDGAREAIGIMPVFKLEPVKDVISEYYNNIDDKTFQFIMLSLGTIIGCYTSSYDITRWYESLTLIFNDRQEKVNENLIPSHYRSDIFGGLFHKALRSSLVFDVTKIDSKTLVSKTFDFLGQSELGKALNETLEKNKSFDKFIDNTVIINYLKATMIFVGLLFYYSARNMSLSTARSEYEKIKSKRDIDKLGESHAVLYQAIMNDRQELTEFYHLLLNASVLYSLFGSVKNAEHANRLDNSPWAKAKIGTEEDYNSPNHKLWIKADDPEIKEKISPYIQQMQKEKGFKRLIKFADDQNLGINRFLFFFRPVNSSSIGPSCTYAYYIYDCLYYFNIYNIFGKDRTGNEKIVFMNTRMETMSRRKMSRSNDMKLMNQSSIDSLYREERECFDETMFTYFAELYKEIMNTYLQGGASTTSAEGVQTSEGKVGGKTEGIKVKEEQGDLFLAKILNMFNVLLTLPPGNYHYVPYFKYLFKALLSGSTYVTINDVRYYISYYLIVLHNISALSRSSANTKVDGTKVSSKSDSRVLAYLIPTSVQVKTSEVYTYPFDFQNELVNKNKARPLYTTLTIQFKPIEDLLYIYATHFTLDEIRRALALDAPDFGGVGRLKDDPCDTHKLETEEVDNPCAEPTPRPQ